MRYTRLVKLVPKAIIGFPNPLCKHDTHGIQLRHGDLYFYVLAAIELTVGDNKYCARLRWFFWLFLGPTQ